MNKTIFVFSILLILVVSMMMTPSQHASALTKRSYFNDAPMTARFGNSQVCGDHICTHGERSDWAMKMSAAQRGGMENYQQLRAYSMQHGEDVMHKVAGSTAQPTTMHGNVKASNTSTK